MESKHSLVDDLFSCFVLDEQKRHTLSFEKNLAGVCVVELRMHGCRHVQDM